MENEEIKRVVAAGYNKLGARFATWAESVRTDERWRYTSLIIDRVPAGEFVLELGCGHGGATTQALANKYKLVGIDLAENLLSLARTASPLGEFICADMADYSYPAAHYACVAAFYCLFHLSRQEHADMVRKIHSTLKPGGLFVGCLGVGNHEPFKEDDFLGVEMVSSSFDAAGNERLFLENGFELEASEVESEPEFGREISFHWIVARKR